MGSRVGVTDATEPQPLGVAVARDEVLQLQGEGGAVAGGLRGGCDAGGEAFERVFEEGGCEKGGGSCVERGGARCPVSTGGLQARPTL